MHTDRLLKSALVLTVLLSGCSAGRDHETSGPVPGSTPSPEPAVSVPPEPSETPAAEPAEQTAASDPVQLAGHYINGFYMTYLMDVSEASDHTMDIEIINNPDFRNYHEWHINAHLSEDAERLEYTESDHKSIIRSEDGKRNEETKTGGSGHFAIGENTLDWNDDETGMTVPFILEDAFRAMSGGQPSENPWTDTIYQEKAEKIAGFTAELPAEEELREGLYFWKYTVRRGVICALYEGAADAVTLYKSPVHTSAELTGDYSETDEWTVSVNDIEVTCRGTDGQIKNAMFSDGNMNYGILCNAGMTGTGLSEEELQTILAVFR